MARLQDIRRLVADNAPPEHRGWVARALVEPINRLLEPIYAALDRGLSVQANLNAQVLEATFTAPSDWADAPQDFVSALRGRCIGVQVLRADELDSSGKPSGNNHGTMGIPDWEEIQPASARAPTIRIRNQTGLTAGQRYRVVWLALGE
ncbi:MAG TPA: hypothetical protein VMY76_00735 [Gemmatimonadales bacterium]|nr:hypothetical protein [Gemmatimonadales bacterium]